MRIEIKNRFTGAVIFSAEMPAEIEALSLSQQRGWAVRQALKCGAYLRGADLRYADLRGADLRDADLRDADLSGAALSEADLSGADLRDADLSGADLSDADLSDADLSDANLRYADLHDANLSDANLRGADLHGANLHGADLSGADLSDADLSGALRLFKADLWMTLSSLPLKKREAEVGHLLAMLKAGKINGAQYNPDPNGCACLVGTLATAGAGLSVEDFKDRNSRNPAESWFLMIRPGDKPENNTGGGFAARHAIEWISEWVTANDMERHENG